MQLFMFIITMVDADLKLTTVEKNKCVLETELQKNYPRVKYLKNIYSSCFWNIFILCIKILNDK